jgi:hypothetical protein
VAERGGVDRMWSRAGARSSARVFASFGESRWNSKRSMTSAWPGMTFPSSARPASVIVTATPRSSSGEVARVTKLLFSSRPA